MKFNLFENLLPPETKIFYGFFEDSAQNCHEMATLFNNALVNGMSEDLLIKAKTLKHRGSNLERETISKLNSTFITPIDREDIQLLAAMLNSITKRIAKAFFNLNVYRIAKFTDEVRQQSKTILNATDELMKSVGL